MVIDIGCQGRVRRWDARVRDELGPGNFRNVYFPISVPSRLVVAAVHGSMQNDGSTRCTFSFQIFNVNFVCKLEHIHRPRMRKGRSAN